jgi:hypothetical protein
MIQIQVANHGVDHLLGVLDGGAAATGRKVLHLYYIANAARSFDAVPQSGSGKLEAHPEVGWVRRA